MQPMGGLLYLICDEDKDIADYQLSCLKTSGQQWSAASGRIGNVPPRPAIYAPKDGIIAGQSEWFEAGEDSASALTCGVDSASALTCGVWEPFENKKLIVLHVSGMPEAMIKAVELTYNISGTINLGQITEILEMHHHTIDQNSFRKSNDGGSYSISFVVKPLIANDTMSTKALANAKRFYRMFSANDVGSHLRCNAEMDDTVSATATLMTRSQDMEQAPMYDIGSDSRCETALANAKRFYRMFISVDILFALAVLSHISKPPWEAQTKTSSPFLGPLLAMLAIDGVLALSICIAIPTQKLTSPLQRGEHNPWCPTPCCFLALSNLLMNILTTFCWGLWKADTMKEDVSLQALLWFLMAAIARGAKLLPMGQLWDALRRFSFGDFEKLEAWRNSCLDEIIGNISERLVQFGVVVIFAVWIIMTIYLWSNGASWSDVFQNYDSQSGLPAEPEERRLRGVVSSSVFFGGVCNETNFNGLTAKFCCDPACKSNIKQYLSKKLKAARNVRKAGKTAIKRGEQGLAIGATSAGAAATVATGAGVLTTATAPVVVAVGAFLCGLFAVFGGIAGLLEGSTDAQEREPAYCVRSENLVGVKAPVSCKQDGQKAAERKRNEAEALECVQIKTGQDVENNGTLIVDINSTAGVQRVAGYHAKGSVVVHDCFTSLNEVRVTGRGIDAWAGSIRYSIDGGRTYGSMWCASGCQGFTDNIVVDGNADSSDQASARCLHGDTCAIVKKACTALDGDVWVTGNEVACCDGLHAKLETCRGNSQCHVCKAHTTIFYEVQQHHLNDISYTVIWSRSPQGAGAAAIGVCGVMIGGVVALIYRTFRRRSASAEPID